MALSDAETDELVRLLGKMERPYSEKLFLALCANIIMSPVEVIALTRDGKVLLTQRSPNDPLFPNFWHSPGSLQFKGDMIQTTLDRVITGELLGAKCSSPEFVGFADVMHGTGPNENPRGQERPLLFIVWVEEGTYTGPGRFSPLNGLPDEIVPHHKNLLLPMIREKLFPLF